MARPNTISTSKLFEETNVDIEGEKFRLRQATRTVEERHRKLARALDAKQAEFESDDDNEATEAAAVELLLEMNGDILDIWLEPMGEKKVHAKTLIKRAYKEDKLGLSHIRELVDLVAEASARRPT